MISDSIFDERINIFDERIKIFDERQIDKGKRAQKETTGSCG